MKKRHLAMIVAITMSAGLIIGCGSSSGGSNDQPPPAFSVSGRWLIDTGMTGVSDYFGVEVDAGNNVLDFFGGLTGGFIITGNAWADSSGNFLIVVALGGTWTLEISGVGVLDASGVHGVGTCTELHPPDPPQSFACEAFLAPAESPLAGSWSGNIDDGGLIPFTMTIDANGAVTAINITGAGTVVETNSVCLADGTGFIQAYNTDNDEFLFHGTLTGITFSGVLEGEFPVFPMGPSPTFTMTKL